LAGGYKITELGTLLSRATLVEQVDENDPPVFGPLCKSMGVLIKPEWTEPDAVDLEGRSVSSENNQLKIGKKKSFDNISVGQAAKNIHGCPRS
jgi:hypothetical protein